VDIKICAVNEVWSGLKFVIPVKNRASRQSQPASAAAEIGKFL
jgi:hypothetical protein